MTINGYVQPTANTIKFNISGVSTAGNVDLVTATNNAYGTAYLSSSQQGTTGASIMNAYVCFSAPVSLVVRRYVLSLAYTSTEIFPAEIAQQPAFHAFFCNPFDQIQLQTSGPCTIQILEIVESKPVG